MPQKTLPMGTEAEFRSMTGRDEDLLVNKKKVQSGEAINELLANCTTRLGEKTTVTPFDIERLSTPDRTALLLAVRTESYGELVETELQCESCKKKFGVTVDLNQLPESPLPDNFDPENGFEAKLSDETVVRFTYLNGTKEKQLVRADKDVVTEAMYLRILAVSNVHANGIKKWLKELPVKFRKELRAAMQATECGPNPEVTADCTNCGAENSFAVQGQPGFFFPAQ